MRRRAAKVDVNQKEIVSGLRQCGFSVSITSALGDGFVDIVVGKWGLNFLVEIKDGKKPPSAKKLTTDEQKFHKEWKGSVMVGESLEDILNKINLYVKKQRKSG